MTDKKCKLKVGLFGIELKAYWEQFTGLKEKLESYLSVVNNRVSA